MQKSAVAAVGGISQPAGIPKGEKANGLLRKLVMVYVWGSAAEVAVVFFLVWLGLEFTSRQLIGLLLITPFAVPFYVLIDVYFIVHQFQPIRAILARLDVGDIPAPEQVSPAVARALNLPFFAFVRMAVIHGPVATIVALAGLVFSNAYFDANFENWQIIGLSATVLFFAAPGHAIFEFFGIARVLNPVYVRLWQYCPRLLDEDRAILVSIKLKEKLLFLAVFLTALPLLFFAVTIVLKVELLLIRLGIGTPIQHLGPLVVWLCGVVVVCILGALIMSALTASEVSRSATRMIKAMKRVKEGKLDQKLFITSMDEYEDLYRGFNMMTGALREEVRFLEVTQGLSGELNLDRLIERIMTATTELLDAERSTLFVYDRKTGELWSRFAEGLGVSEIRVPSTHGIAGAVFASGDSQNISDPYSHPLFNREVDRRTGFKTRSILCMPIVNKAGERIGVTQVLNKRGGAFTSKDEARLRAFTAQVGVSLENAQLFDDVLNMKNYNEGILRSTTNSMVTLDTRYKVVTANAAAVKLLRMPAEEIIGRTAKQLFGGRNDWLVGSILSVVHTGESEFSADAMLKLHDGKSASVNATVSPLIDINDESIGSMIILEDISNEKRVRTTMARYMSKEVADQLLAAGESELGGKVQHVSILFSDVRSFTSIAESLGARETVSMLNEYFEDMVDVILNNGGILDKYIGDAIMALFGAPFSGEHDADNAVKVANDMLVALRALNERRAAGGKKPITVGIGVNSGDAIVGSIGSTKRMEYTVIGDSVNLASRLEGANKFYGTNILVSDITVGELKNVPPRMREIDLIRVKGKDQPVAVHEVLGYHTAATFPNMEGALGAFADGLAAYRARDWTKAIACFEAALKANAGDTPSRIYLDRCRHYLAVPPGDGWDGVWVMIEK